MGHCHCGRCRKACGGVFHTTLMVRGGYFGWRSGRDLVGSYTPDPPFNIVRDFCRSCGCYLGELTSVEPRIVSAGLLDGDPGRRPHGHEWTSDAVPGTWIDDGLPCFAEHFPLPEVWSDPAALAARQTDPPPRLPEREPELPIRGGCLCGAVAFEVHRPLTGVLHCHCADCRRAQGCDFVTNGSADPAAFRFVRGAESVHGYASSPGIERCFCGYCGSSLFVRSAQPGTPVRVHLGSLDGDPGARPLAHVWTGQRVPWQALSAELPVFEKGWVRPTRA